MRYPNRSNRRRQGASPVGGEAAPGGAEGGAEGGRRSPKGRTTFDTAVGLLALRPHAALEIRRKLRQKGHEPEEIEAALTRLSELGYLDDADFARVLVGWRSGKRGRRAIASELAQRGVSRDQAEIALADLDPEVEIEAATRLAAGALRSGDPTALARAAARLRRRGFAESVIRAVMRRAAVDPDAEVVEARD